MRSSQRMDFMPNCITVNSMLNPHATKISYPILNTYLEDYYHAIQA